MNVDKSIANWHSKLDASQAAFEESFGYLTEKELLMKPSPSAWSIGQNILHIVVTNESYYPVLEALHRGTYEAPWHGKIGFVVRFMGREILKSVRETHAKPYKTFPIWEPKEMAEAGNILVRLGEHHASMKDKMMTAKVFLENGAVIASPGSRKVVYTLHAAFEIMVAHEFRHLAQSRRVLAAIGI